MIKLQDTCFFFTECLCFFRIIDHRLTCQNFLNTICRHSRSWKHDRNHTDHQESHNNLHRILNKCHHISNLHLTVTDSMCPVPYDQNRNTIHDQNHRRHHKCHRTVNKQIRSRQVFVSCVKPLFFMLFCTECSNH